MALSKAAQREREAISDLRRAVGLLYTASSKFRADSTGTILSGQLAAAVLILENVVDTVDRRTS